ncbi:MAG: hypothetical protein RL088_1490 [Verrucomicrobiota bacterium]
MHRAVTGNLAVCCIHAVTVAFPSGGHFGPRFAARRSHSASISSYVVSMTANYRLTPDSAYSGSALKGGWFVGMARGVAFMGRGCLPNGGNWQCGVGFGAESGGELLMAVPLANCGLRALTGAVALIAGIIKQRTSVMHDFNFLHRPRTALTFVALGRA